MIDRDTWITTLCRSRNLRDNAKAWALVAWHHVDDSGHVRSRASDIRQSLGWTQGWAERVVRDLRDAGYIVSGDGALMIAVP